MPSLATEQLSTVVGMPATSFVPRRYFPGDVSAWAGHVPFAYDLVGAIQPELIVELGTHWGESYFTFCQSVAEHEVPALCYAVDTWVGEEHAGFYDESVYQDVAGHNQKFYKAFSYLLRTTFDEARGQFADESIDLLHIDGLHTHDAVSHDFRTWFPKVRPGGIVLLHDVNGRQQDFGVWRLWEALRAEFPDTFTFSQWWGLGVLRKPGGKRREPFLDLLFGSAPQVQERIRRHYMLYSSYLETTLRAPKLVPTAFPNIQVYPLGGAGFSEETSQAEPVEFEEFKTVTFEFPDGCESGVFRLDPADCPCVVEISALTVAGHWSAKTPGELRALSVAGTAGLLADSDSYRLFCYGNDPQVALPNLGPLSGPLRLTISLRLTRDFSSVWQSIAQGDARCTDLLSAKADLESKALSFNAHISDLKKHASASELDAQAARGELETLKGGQQALQSENAALREQLAVEQEKRAAEEAKRAAMEQSRSWKLTKPLRNLRPS